MILTLWAVFRTEYTL